MKLFNFKKLFIQYKIVLEFLLLQFIMLILLCLSFFIDTVQIKFILYVIMIVISILLYFILYKLCLKIIDKAKLEAEILLLQEQRKIQYEYIKASQEKRENFQMIKDVIINHIEMNDMEYDDKEVRKKTSFILKEYESLYTFDYCQNKVIDAILYNKVLLAKSYNIHTVVQVIVPEKLAIKNIDLMFLFTNLLDNAIEACVKLPIKKRYIEIEAMIKTNYLIVKVKNSKDVLVNVDKNSQSSKNDKEKHGLGLQIIKICCKENKGTFTLIDKGEILEAYATLLAGEEDNI